MNDTIDNKELLERIVKLETTAKMLGTRYAKIRRLFTKIVMLIILVLAILIAHVIYTGVAYGWR